jgi:purine nucleoside phosphorylase
VIAAVHSGMKVTGLSIISDIENLYRSPHDRMASILEAANDAAHVISMLTSKIVSASGARN